MIARGHSSAANGTGVVAVESSPEARGTATTRAAAGIRPPSVLRGAKFQGAAIDWLRFSGPVSSLDELVKQLTKDYGRPDGGKGRFFLSSSWRWAGGLVLAFDPETPESAEHCVLEVPGGFLAPLAHRDRVRVMNAVMYLGFKVTRLDAALDWRGQSIGLIEAMRQSCDAGQLCGARTWSYHAERSAAGELTGEMLTVGKRGKNGSGRYVRVYDKGLEQKTQAAGEWVRYEVEFSDQCAQQVAMRVLLGKWGSEQALIEAALGALDYREKTGHRALSRRPRVTWWAEFIAGVEPVKVQTVRATPRLESWAKWMNRCVAPQLETLAVALGRDFVTWWREVVGEEQIKPRVLDGDVASDVLRSLGVKFADAERRVLAAQAKGAA